jgi:hypothetical protein
MKAKQVLLNSLNQFRKKNIVILTAYRYDECLSWRASDKARVVRPR